MSEKIYTRIELDELLSNIIGKTFEEVDKEKLFEGQKGKTINKMDKGIFGKVVEKSVLGMALNSRKEPDIDVDYAGTEEAYRGIVNTELKTTGMHINPSGKLLPKERVTVTDVSIGTIEHETFDNSAFNHKLLHILWIFYEYKWIKYQKERYSPYEMRKFKFINYGFTHMKERQEDYLRFKHDWLIIHNYLVLHQNDEDKEEVWYPKLHENTKKDLLYINIAPRYPHPPRFGIKNSFVGTMYEILYEQKKYENLSVCIDSYDDLNKMLHEKYLLYRNRTIIDISQELFIKIPSVKNITETVSIRMFDKNIKKLNRIELFNKSGIIIKTITLNPSGRNTENGTKLFKLDIDEFSNPDIKYEETNYFDYFNNHRFLFIVYEEKNDAEPNEEHRFLGFKWFDFTEELIYGECLETWKIIRDRIINKTLEIKNNAPNFPKSKDHIIFVRGSNQKDKKTGTYKNQWNINGLKMHPQQIWIKGLFISQYLAETDYI